MPFAPRSASLPPDFNYISKNRSILLIRKKFESDDFSVKLILLGKKMTPLP
jgi:hypothetical protein